MGKAVLSVTLVLLIIYVVPFLVYGAFSALGGLKPPEGASPRQFLVSVFVSKVGTAVTFVLILYFAGDGLTGQWRLYALLWWLMFVIGEVGQAMGPNYSWIEALAGIISETVYCPLSAFTAASLIGVK